MFILARERERDVKQKCDIISLCKRKSNKTNDMFILANPGLYEFIICIINCRKTKLNLILNNII